MNSDRPSIVSSLPNEERSLVKHTKVYLAELRLAAQKQGSVVNHGLLARALGYRQHPGASHLQTQGPIRIYRLLGFERDRLDHQSSRLIALAVETQLEMVTGRNGEVVSANLVQGAHLWLSEVSMQEWKVEGHTFKLTPLLEPPPRTWAPAPLPPKIVSYDISAKSMVNGVPFIAPGDPVTVSWQVESFGATDTKVWLMASTIQTDSKGRSFSGLAWEMDNLPLNGSINLNPQEFTEYALWANTPSLGGVSDSRSGSVLIDPQAPVAGPRTGSPVPVGAWFYFKIESDDPDSADPCHTIAIFAADEQAAAQLVWQSGYSASPIDFQQYSSGDACSS